MSSAMGKHFRTGISLSLGDFSGKLPGLRIGRLPGTKIDRPAMAVIGAVLMFVFGGLAPKQASPASISPRWSCSSR